MRRCNVLSIRYNVTLVYRYTVRNKNMPLRIYVYVHNFEKCCPILNILSLLDSAVTLQQGS